MDKSYNPFPIAKFALAKTHEAKKRIKNRIFDSVAEGIRERVSEGKFSFSILSIDGVELYKREILLVLRENGYLVDFETGEINWEN